MLARPKKVPNIRHSHFPSWCERKLLLLLILIASASSSSSSASSASSFCQTPMKKSMSCCQVSQANRGCSPPTFGSPGSRSYSPAPPGQLEFQYLGQLDRQINTSSLCENSIRCLIIQIYLPIYVYNIYIYAVQLTYHNTVGIKKGRHHPCWASASQSSSTSSTVTLAISNGSA